MVTLNPENMMETCQIGRDREDVGSKLEELGGRGMSLQYRGACQSQVLLQAQNL